MAYNKKTFVNDITPPIDADYLNGVEDELEMLDGAVGECFVIEKSAGYVTIQLPFTIEINESYTVILKSGRTGIATRSSENGSNIDVIFPNNTEAVSYATFTATANAQYLRLSADTAVSFVIGKADGQMMSTMYDATSTKKSSETTNGVLGDIFSYDFASGVYVNVELPFEIKSGKTYTLVLKSGTSGFSTANSIFDTGIDVIMDINTNAPAIATFTATANANWIRIKRSSAGRFVIGESEGEIADVENDIFGIKNDISGFSSDISTLNNDVDDINDKIGQYVEMTKPAAFDSYELPFELISGKKYTVILKSGKTGIATRATSQGANIDEIFPNNTEAVVAKTFTASANAKYLRVTASAISTFVIGDADGQILWASGDVVELKDQVKVINDVLGTVAFFEHARTYYTQELPFDIVSGKSYTFILKSGQTRVWTRLTESGATVDTVIDPAQNAPYSVTFTATGNAKYLRVAADSDVRFIFGETKSEIISLELKEAKLTSYLTPIFAPTQTISADGSSGSDFDAATCQTADIYTYLDNIVSEFPNYLTKEFLGKDESGTKDIYRYVAFERNKIAWVKDDYPQMYEVKNGSTSKYAESASPRVGDKLYASANTAASYITVSSVDNENQAVVGSDSVTYTKTFEITDATVVYQYIFDPSNPSSMKLYSKDGTYLNYDASSISGDTMTDTNGVTYTRVPIYDINEKDYTPTLYIHANEHGPVSDPRICAIVLCRMIKDLANGYNLDNKLLKFFRTRCKLVIIPVLNPYGFDIGGDYGRYNYNVVNINRNYDTPGWAAIADSDKGQYGGSENETQYAMNTFMESHADVGLSIHCLGISSANNFKCHYESLSRDLNNNLITVMREQMLNGYNLKLSPYTLKPWDEGAESSSYISHFCPGGLMEMNAVYGDYQLGDAYDKKIVEADYTLLLNLLYMWLQKAIDFDISKIQ